MASSLVLSLVLQVFSAQQPQESSYNKPFHGTLMLLLSISLLVKAKVLSLAKGTHTV